MNNKKYIKLQFSDTDDGQKDQLIALLADIGFTGFEEEKKTLNAFIEEKNFNNNELADVLKIIPASYSKTTVEEENWNALWESSFEPILVSDFVGIRAFFHPPVEHVRHEIVITPKMSFGTGHHATTFMMIEQMEALDITEKTVMDFGTGTAVLAILAEKMGAVKIDAVDYDDWSIKNSIENVAANNCSTINLIKDETISTGSVYDIILANINLNVIISNMDAIKAAAKKGAYILLSGFTRADEAFMLEKLEKNGICPLKTVQKDEWLSILAEMR
ncbi:MAG: 50S ribosomal protein L11 methyltransferase [Ferruginibacter sp.]|nr:50S ribosomal protein L11 methyltransferase [Ferruginibacter sp.]